MRPPERTLPVLGRDESSCLRNWLRSKVGQRKMAALGWVLERGAGKERSREEHERVRSVGATQIAMAALQSISHLDLNFWPQRHFLFDSRDSNPFYIEKCFAAFPRSAIAVLASNLCAQGRRSRGARQWPQREQGRSSRHPLRQSGGWYVDDTHVILVWCTGDT